jgi:hypothetical protein
MRAGRLNPDIPQGSAGLESPAHKAASGWAVAEAAVGVGRVLTNAATSTRELELPPTRQSYRFPMEVVLL